MLASHEAASQAEARVGGVCQEVAAVLGVLGALASQEAASQAEARGGGVCQQVVSAVRPAKGDCDKLGRQWP